MRQYPRTKPNCPGAGLAYFTLVMVVVVFTGPATIDRDLREVSSHWDLPAPYLAAAVENSADGNGREEPCAAGVARLPILVGFDVHKRSAKALHSPTAAHRALGDPPVDEGGVSFREDTARTPSCIALRRLLL